MIINGKNMHEFTGSRVKVIVTSRCTAACKHCYLSAEGTRSNVETMKIIDALQGKYDVRLDGSEMLLDEEYIRMMRLVGQDNVQTNGKLVLRDPERCIRILNENDIKDVYFSYHYGIQEELTDISLDDVERAIAIMKQAGFSVGLMCTVTSHNMHMLEEACQKAVELGAFSIQFNPILLQGNAKKYMGNQVLTHSDREQLKEQLAVLYEKFAHRLVVDPGKAFEFCPHEEFFCRSVTRKVWIGLDNKVYPCIFLIEHGMDIGVYEDGKVWIEDDVHWGGKRCAAYLHCNEHVNLWNRGNHPSCRVGTSCVIEG